MSRLAAWLTAVGLSISAVGAAGAQIAERFDYLVREDMFRGFSGDTAAFERAMALCEARLAADPNNAEALVWHGTGLLFRAGEAARTGDHDKGAALNRAGLAEMAKAVALRPNDISVLIPRGSVMLAAGTRIPDVERARRFFETAVGDFEKVLALQQPYLESLPPHPKGELLAALAEGWSRLGEMQKSQLYLTRMVAELTDTPYSAAAMARLENPAAGARITCLGCHTK
jgi:tetratricopeptide (TPR) repeat protein